MNHNEVLVIKGKLFTFLFLSVFVAISWSGENDIDQSVPWDAEKFPTPKREISVIVSKHGYFPDHISIFSGEKVKFFVTASDESPMCLILPAYSLFLSANMGKIAEGEVFFDRPGVFDFHCPAGGQKGRITVLARKIYQQRSVASEKKNNQVWRPAAAPVSY